MDGIWPIVAFTLLVLLLTGPGMWSSRYGWSDLLQKRKDPSYRPPPRDGRGPPRR